MTVQSRTADWFEVKVRYGKHTEEGFYKKVTELYVVDALTFTEAEQRVTARLSALTGDSLEVLAIARAPYKELIISTDPGDDRFFRARVQYDVATDGRPRHHTVCILVQASLIDRAKHAIDDLHDTIFTDYAIVSIVETRIVDVYTYTGAEAKAGVEEEEEEDTVEGILKDDGGEEEEETTGGNNL